MSLSFNIWAISLILIFHSPSPWYRYTASQLLSLVLSSGRFLISPHRTHEKFHFLSQIFSPHQDLSILYSRVRRLPFQLMPFREPSWGNYPLIREDRHHTLSLSWFAFSHSMNGFKVSLHSLLRNFPLSALSIMRFLSALLSPEDGTLSQYSLISFLSIYSEFLRRFLAFWLLSSSSHYHSPSILNFIAIEECLMDLSPHRMKQIFPLPFPYISFWFSLCRLLQIEFSSYCQVSMNCHSCSISDILSECALASKRKCSLSFNF